MSYSDDDAKYYRLLEKLLALEEENKLLRKEIEKLKKEKEKRGGR